MEKEIIAAIISASGTFGSALAVGIAGSLISKKFAQKRDIQDKESQWRSHAIELTKLELQRKISTNNENKSIRPNILDFLANYRDLKELDDVKNMTPGKLYDKIMKDRIIHNPPNEIDKSDDKKSVTNSEKK